MARTADRVNKLGVHHQRCVRQNQQGPTRGSEAIGHILQHLLIYAAGQPEVLLQHHIRQAEQGVEALRDKVPGHVIQALARAHPQPSTRGGQLGLAMTWRASYGRM